MENEHISWSAWYYSEDTHYGLFSIISIIIVGTLSICHLCLHVLVCVHMPTCVWVHVCAHLSEQESCLSVKAIMIDLGTTLKPNQMISPHSSVALSLLASPPLLSRSTSASSRPPLFKLNTLGMHLSSGYKSPFYHPFHRPPPPPQLQPFSQRKEKRGHQQLPESPHAQQKPTRWQFVERKCNLSPSTPSWGGGQTMRGSD